MLFLLSSLALADIPPPEDYVETCTVENHQAEGRECSSCSGWHGGREDCEALEAKGYAAVCQTAGASAWTEVMCKGEAPADPSGDTPPAPPPKRKLCATSPVPASIGLGWLIGLAMLRRRRA